MSLEKSNALYQIQVCILRFRYTGKDTVTKELLLYDIAKSDVITQDKKSMIVDSFVLWHVTDPKVFAQTLNTSEQNAESRINVAVYNSIKKCDQ